MPGQALIQVASEDARGSRGRVEVLLKVTGQPGSSTVLQSLPYDRGLMHAGMAGMDLPGMAMTGAQREALIRFQTSEDPAVEAAPIPAHLRDVEALPLQGATERKFELSENMMALDFRINGRKFDPQRVDLHIPLGSTEIWSVQNTGDMDHPFHLHGTSFQVLDRNGVAEPFRAWKDTVKVRKGETVRFAVQFKDFKGPRMFHGHILEHEDLGMMGLLQVA